MKKGLFDDSEYYPKKGPLESLLDKAKTSIKTIDRIIKSQKTDNSPPDIMAEIESFPEITYELPEGENVVNLHLQTYQPETIAVPTQELRNIVDALEAGLEHTQTVLSEHDASLGRTTRKNKNWAESLEKDVEFLSNQMKLLKLKLIVATTHYP